MSNYSRLGIVLSVLLGALLLCSLGGGGCGTAPTEPTPAAPPPPAPPAQRTITWKGLDTEYRGTTEIDGTGKVRQQR